jgi:hypothetical protein
MAQDAASQYPMGMNSADMQNMMQQMQKAQACMEKIDQDEIQALEEKAKAIQADMKSLCAKGERDKAQQKAMSYAKDIMGNPTVKELQKCSKMMQGAMKGMMPDMSLLSEDKDYTSKHVCDAL